VVLQRADALEHGFAFRCALAHVSGNQCLARTLERRGALDILLARDFQQCFDRGAFGMASVTRGAAGQNACFHAGMIEQNDGAREGFRAAQGKYFDLAGQHRLAWPGATVAAALPVRAPLHLGLCRPLP
jgi:hypothetical protein